MDVSSEEPWHIVRPRRISLVVAVTEPKYVKSALSCDFIGVHFRRFRMRITVTVRHFFTAAVIITKYVVPLV